MIPVAEAVDPVALCVREGLTATPKTLPPWLFYDAAGSELFERITELPEYYLTRTERALLAQHAGAILERVGARVSVVELGAGTATKTGLLLAEAVARQGQVLYQPIDVSESALEEASRMLEAQLPGVTVEPVVANYVTEPPRLLREPGKAILALYIGSSIGNFSPADARMILSNLRGQLKRGDALLLGTDLAPHAAKTVAALEAAYDDRAGVTAAFNRNVLVRLNRELGANFDMDCFQHRARWNAPESRMEMHLESSRGQTVRIPANGAGAETRVRFAAGETIHTENSYKFTVGRVAELVEGCGFSVAETYQDEAGMFLVTLALAV